MITVVKVRFLSGWTDPIAEATVLVEIRRNSAHRLLKECSTLYG